MRKQFGSLLGIGVLAIGAAALLAGPAGAATRPFVKAFGHPVEVGSTMPSNGDVNPYGIAVVTETAGALTAGNTLVSNFNDKTNVQGTGSTIVELNPNGAHTTFSNLAGTTSCPGGVGLTTALAILPGDWVVVGSLPAGKNGVLPSAKPAGCLVVLNSTGSVVETWSNQYIDGPWDLVADASGSTASIFVSNTLANPSGHHAIPTKGQGTVTRLTVDLSPTAPPTLAGEAVIANKLPWKANKTAFVIGPTGLALGMTGTLYVDDTLTNSVFAIPKALTRSTPARARLLSSKGALNAPLGMLLAPNGDIVVSNGGDGNVVEISPSGRQVAHKSLVTKGAGDLFGMVLTREGTGMDFVNDGTNSVDLVR